MPKEKLINENEKDFTISASFDRKNLYNSSLEDIIDNPISCLAIVKKKTKRRKDF